MKLDDNRRMYHYIITINKKYRLNSERIKAICEYYKDRFQEELIYYDTVIRNIVFEKENVLGKPHIHMTIETEYRLTIKEIIKTTEKLNRELSKYMILLGMKDKDNEPILYNTSANVMCKDYNKDSCPGKRYCNKMTLIDDSLLKCQLPTILIPCTEHMISDKGKKLILNNNLHISNLCKYLENKINKQNTLYYYDNETYEGKLGKYRTDLKEVN